MDQPTFKVSIQSFLQSKKKVEQIRKKKTIQPRPSGQITMLSTVVLEGTNLQHPGIVI